MEQNKKKMGQPVLGYPNLKQTKKKQQQQLINIKTDGNHNAM